MLIYAEGQDYTPALPKRHFHIAGDPDRVKAQAEDGPSIDMNFDLGDDLVDRDKMSVGRDVYRDNLVDD